jgi:predicted enzyme related to lactoylglutathione lyase
MTIGIRDNGEFCWINMITPQPTEAQRFFSELFNWTYVPMTGVSGWSIQVGTSSIGGMFDRDHPMTPPGTPPLIGVAIKVESADDFCVRAAALGGRARSPMDVLDAGRMVVCHDPDGAELDAWQPRKMPGTDVDSTAHGAPGWFQVMTRDSDRAARFYSGLFGWKARVFPERGGYTVFSRGNHDLAGMMQIGPMTGPAQPHWSTWITVDNVDLAARRAEALGGKLCLQPTDIPDVGRFCAVTSPEGVPFHAVTWDPAMFAAKGR